MYSNVVNLETSPFTKSQTSPFTPSSVNRFTPSSINQIQGAPPHYATEARSTSNVHRFTKCDVFTPSSIAKQMAEKLGTYRTRTLLEPSVGQGSLLEFIDKDAFDTIDVYDINKTYMDKIEHHPNMTKFPVDFLRANLKVDKTQKTYDNIIMNPPYVKIQDLSPEYREFLKTEFKEQLGKGLVDIYYAFIVKCLSVLSDSGRMVAITPNSFLYNKSAISLRKFLIENRYIEEIIDFGTEKVFPGVSVYCCITVFTKTQKTTLKYNGKIIEYGRIQSPDYSIFVKTTEQSNQTENGQEPSNQTNEVAPRTKTLRDICTITNGIATLRDKIYIHPKKLYDEPCWKPITTGPEDKYVIYPYDSNAKIIDETVFQRDNPKTYEYLLQNKAELAQRDKGNKKYPAWYSYGRTQSLKISTRPHVIYIPAFLNPESYELYTKPPTLFQSCLCIEPKNQNDLDSVKTLETIRQTIKKGMATLREMSSKRSGGWITISSTNLYKLQILQ